MKSAGKARSNGLYRHIRTSKEIIRNLLNDLPNYINTSILDAFHDTHMVGLPVLGARAALIVPIEEDGHARYRLSRAVHPSLISSIIFSMHMSDALRTGTISARKPLPIRRNFQIFPLGTFSNGIQSVIMCLST